MITELPADPNLKDLQLPFEAQYWELSKRTWTTAARCYEDMVMFFGAERKPRDIFRSDVAEYKEWLRKKGRTERSIGIHVDIGVRLYRFLDDLGLTETGLNPFTGMQPKRIQVTPRR